MTESVNEIIGDLPHLNKSSKINITGIVLRNPERFCINLENKGSAPDAILKLQVDFDYKGMEHVFVISSDYGENRVEKGGNSFPFQAGPFDLSFSFKTDQFVIQVGSNNVAVYPLYSTIENINQYRISGDIKDIKVNVDP